MSTQRQASSTSLSGERPSFNDQVVPGPNERLLESLPSSWVNGSSSGPGVRHVPELRPKSFHPEGDDSVVLERQPAHLGGLVTRGRPGSLAAASRVEAPRPGGRRTGPSRGRRVRDRRLVWSCRELTLGSVS